MNRQLKPAKDPAELRRRAEVRLSVHPLKKATPNSTAADNQRQLHELEVHQIELEMQNEELEDARAKLEALLEKYTDLYDFAPVGYLTLDREGMIHEANLTSASLLGVARSAMVNRSFGFFVAPADRPIFGAFLQQVFRSGVREEHEVRLLVAGKLPIDVRLAAIVFESGDSCRLALTDITAHKRSAADHLILNKLESTGILAGGIAHDFNNLFTVILLNLELAQAVKPGDVNLARYLAEAKETSLLARGLTAQLVTFSEGGAPIRKRMFLSGLIRESVRPALSGSPIRCEFSLAEDLWGTEADANQIGQVIRNLVLNAREAMPQGGVVFVRAENVVLGDEALAALPAGDYVRVSVIDQGTGIPPEVLPKIFDPYFSTKQRGQQKGMGLGLTICHAVVQKHEGAIDVRSEVGVGTTFQLYLPAVRNMSGQAPAPAVRAVPRPGKVLVMDDEEGLRKIIGLSLWGMGHQTEVAADGQQAVELYQQAKRSGHPFDVVILDLTIRGGMGGLETIQALLQIDPAVKGIAMSGYAIDPVILEPERHGFKATLAKPFDLGKLQETLGRVMGRPAESPVAP